MCQHQAVLARKVRWVPKGVCSWVFLLVIQVMKALSWCFLVDVGRLRVLLAPQWVQR